MTHTPGPWTVDKNGYINGADGYTIGHFEDEDNACLVAAAPEMLAALEAIVEWNQYRYPDLKKRIEQAAAAIAKAKRG